MMIDCRTESFTYKTIGDCKVEADIHRLESDSIQPILVWIHGGALIKGHRQSIPVHQLHMYLNEGLTVVSLDYRLAPETKLKAIIEDIQDAYQWVRNEVPKWARTDSDRVAIMGQSAGGYLTLMMGFCVSPRPKALIAFYGYGDILSTWYRHPDPFYLRQPLVSKEEAYGAITNRIVANSVGLSNRDRLYLYCRQQGLWPQLVAGFDADSLPDALDAFRPVRNVTPEYPPTLLLHGDADTDVPYEESVEMSRQLGRYGVKHQLITLPGKGHVFDAEVEDPLVKSAFGTVLGFVREHLLVERAERAPDVDGDRTGHFTGKRGRISAIEFGTGGRS